MKKNRQQFKNDRISEKGFTLVETLIAIFIFSLALTALSTIASRGISGNRGAANEVIAQYLTQEGIEAVRHIRDSNYAATVNGNSTLWNTGIPTSCTSSSPCKIELDLSNPLNLPQMVITPCVQTPTCEPLLYDSTTKLYRYTTSTGTPTIFHRAIIVRTLGTAIEVTSRVEWNEGSLPRATEAIEILTNWQNL